MRAFTGDLANGQVTARGNPCTVVVASTKAAAVPIRSPVTSDITQCYTWPKGDRAAHVSCYTAAGTPILCCGHGLLSCAAVWTSYWGGQGSLQAGETTLLCKWQDDALWLGFPKVPSADSPAQNSLVPDWLEPLLAVPVVSCREVGDTQGYLIAELEADCDLRNLEPPGDSLIQYTRRALIVTCRSKATSSEAGERFHFRYFAPQYGVPEDAATGSAMRLLTSYWQQLAVGGKVLALQCSPAGGWLRGCITQDRVWIGGDVEAEVGTSV
ncbi:MAG: putative PhzF superfamily epimerase YddE/YHI9 [Bacteroidia bacterium]|jgi:predicted PhzF superfamily epimerase YddE/YHI9